MFRSLASPRLICPPARSLPVASANPAIGRATHDVELHQSNTCTRNPARPDRSARGSHKSGPPGRRCRGPSPSAVPPPCPARGPPSCTRGSSPTGPGAPPPRPLSAPYTTGAPTRSSLRPIPRTAPSVSIRAAPAIRTTSVYRRFLRPPSTRRPVNRDQGSYRARRRKTIRFLKIHGAQYIDPSMTARITGIFAPNLVPLDEHGRINEPELRRFVDWLIDRGVHGL